MLQYICATFVTNLLRRSFKNRPICSHWSPVTYRASFVWLLQRFEMTSLVSFKLRPAPFKVTKIDSMKWLVWSSYFVKNGPSPSASFSLFSFFKQLKVNIEVFRNQKNVLPMNSLGKVLFLRHHSLELLWSVIRWKMSDKPLGKLVPKGKNW